LSLLSRLDSCFLCTRDGKKDRRKENRRRGREKRPEKGRVKRGEK